MNTTDVIALAALVISSAALALELRRWIESGPKVRLQASQKRSLLTKLGAKDQTTENKVFLAVTNAGDTPTVVTHIFTATYNSWWSRFRDKASHYEHFYDEEKKAAIMRLDPGSLTSTAIHPRDSFSLKDDNLWFGIYCSHRPKPYLCRLQR